MSWALCRMSLSGRPERRYYSNVPTRIRTNRLNFDARRLVPRQGGIMENLERRTFMKGAGFGLLAFTVGSAKVLMTPGQARAQNVPFRLLKANEGAVIE